MDAYCLIKTRMQVLHKIKENLYRYHISVGARFFFSATYILYVLPLIKRQIPDDIVFGAFLGLIGLVGARALMGFGIIAQASRNISYYLGKEDWIGLKKTFHLGTFTSMIILFIFSTIALFFGDSFLARLFGVQNLTDVMVFSRVSLIFAMLLIVGGIFDICTMFLAGVNLHYKIGIAEIIMVSLLSILLTFTVKVIPLKYISTYLLLSCYLFAQGISTTVISVFTIRKYLEIKAALQYGNSAPVNLVTGHLLKDSFYFQTVVVSQSIMVPTYHVLMANLVGLGAVGAFDLARQIVSRICSIFASLQAPLVNVISQIKGGVDKGSVNYNLDMDLVTPFLIFVIICAFPIIVVLNLHGDTVAMLWLGEVDHKVMASLPIIANALFSALITEAMYRYLLGIGDIRYLYWTRLFSFGVGGLVLFFSGNLKNIDFTNIVWSYASIMYITAIMVCLRYWQIRSHFAVTHVFLVWGIALFLAAALGGVIGGIVLGLFAAYTGPLLGIVFCFGTSVVVSAVLSLAFLEPLRTLALKRIRTFPYSQKQ
ncbi:MAG: hypothetical protein ACFFCW_38220 [Candidatus Hodarchaeota archaeon]